MRVVYTFRINKIIYFKSMKFSKIALVATIVLAASLESLTRAESKRRESKLDNIANDRDDCSNKGSCPTWFICNSHGNCQCGNTDNGIVVCDDKLKLSAVLDCNCVTYDGKTKSTYAGNCFYNCERRHSVRKTDPVYDNLPKRSELLINNSACTRFHRTGLLCGDCEDGHSPLILSYNLSCVECPDGHKNWWKFILVAFVPLTFFYFFMVMFNINVTSSRLHGVVWISQALSIPVLVRLTMSSLEQGQSKLLIFAKVLLFFCSFWNLEPFRSVLPDICLNVTTLQALALEYTVALYPFILIVISYFIILLYDRKCICLVAVWKPFHKVLTLFRKSWNVRTSTIDSFATFFFLSYIKIISVSMDILAPTQIYQLGSNKSTYGLYYSPSVAYFGRDHLPYAILAIIILTAFVCVPTTIFFLYPFQFFQKILSLFPVNWYFLRVFVDAYQGGYKDGTQPGTFDCRWFSAVVVFSRPLMLILYCATLNAMYFIYGLVILMIILIAMINIQPFKKIAVRYPSTDPIFVILLSLFYIALLGRLVMNIQNYSLFLAVTVLLLLSTLVPLVYITFLICYWLVSKRRWVSTIGEILRLKFMAT